MDDRLRVWLLTVGHGWAIIESSEVLSDKEIPGNELSYILGREGYCSVLYNTTINMPALPTQNRRVVLAERPNRGPITEKTFNLDTAKIESLKDGQILVKVLYTSIVSPAH
jgi:hypothetical protein